MLRSTRQAGMDTLNEIYQTFLGSWTLRIAPLYIVTTLVIGAVLYRYRERGAGISGFLGWLFPKNIYLHASHLNDIKIFLFGRLLAFFGILNMLVVSPLTVIAVVEGLNGIDGSAADKSATTGIGQALAVTLIFVVVTDFCVYWVHRLHHEWPVIWPFHAVHHSAEVMTPITVYRKHPVYDLISFFVKNVAIGLVTGLVLYAVFGKVTYLQVGQANIFYVLFNLAGSNFRHSHIWISYGRLLEHVLISPAQHQIHHSSAVPHHNKNYGEIFALWDWMFGTLYVPERHEELTFGLADGDGNRIEQLHPSLRQTLVQPVVASAREIRARLTRRGSGKTPAPLETAGTIPREPADP